MDGIENVCLTCTLPACDERDPRCAIRPLMCASWRKSNPVRGEAAEYDLVRRRRESQRKYDAKPEVKARRNARQNAKRKAAREAFKATGKLPSYSAADRRDYFREYKRRKKREQMEAQQ